MKISLKDLIWLFLFFITIFFMGVSIGKMSIVLGILSHLAFIILISVKSNNIFYRKRYLIKDKQSEKISEINKEAIQKIKEINQSYSNKLK